MFRALFMSVILITVIALDTAKASMDIGNPNIQQASVKSEKKNCKDYFIDINVLQNSCIR